jgi:hypothetical protein
MSETDTTETGPEPMWEFEYEDGILDLCSPFRFDPEERMWKLPLAMPKLEKGLTDFIKAKLPPGVCSAWGNVYCHPDGGYTVECHWSDEDAEDAKGDE